MVTPLALSDRQRAELFLSLSRALSAGLPPERALAALNDVCDGALARPLRLASHAVGKGRPLAVALDDRGLITEQDYASLAAAESSGTLDRVLERLADGYERADARWRKLRGRLALPGFVLALGVLVLPLPSMLAGTLSAGGYLLRALGSLVALLVGVLAARAIARSWRARGVPTPLSRALRLLPPLARLAALHERAQVNERLALALASGVPAHEALDDLLRAEANGVRREHLIVARATLGGGRGVADALEHAGLLDPREGYPVVMAGEAAGRLEASLRRYALGCHEALDGVYDLIARWLPVIAYAAVAALLVSGLLG